MYFIFIFILVSHSLFEVHIRAPSKSALRTAGTIQGWLSQQDFLHTQRFKLETFGYRQDIFLLLIMFDIIKEKIHK